MRDRSSTTEAKTVDQTDDFFGTRVAVPTAGSRTPTIPKWCVGRGENALTRGQIEKIPYRGVIVKRLTELLGLPARRLAGEAREWVFFSKNSAYKPGRTLQNRRASRVAGGPPRSNTLSKDGTVAISEVAYSDDGKLWVMGSPRAARLADAARPRRGHGKDRKDVLLRCRFTGIAWGRMRALLLLALSAPGSVAKARKSSGRSSTSTAGRSAEQGPPGIRTHRQQGGGTAPASATTAAGCS